MFNQSLNMLTVYFSTCSQHGGKLTWMFKLCKIALSSCRNSPPWKWMLLVSNSGIKASTWKNTTKTRVVGCSFLIQKLKQLKQGKLYLNVINHLNLVFWLWIKFKMEVHQSLHQEVPQTHTSTTTYRRGSKMILMISTRLLTIDCLICNPLRKLKVSRRIQLQIVKNQLKTMIKNLALQFLAVK